MPPGGCGRPPPGASLAPRSPPHAPRSPAPSGSWPAAAGGGGMPAGPAAAISFLQAAGRAGAAALLHQLIAVSPSLAQLMASVAASEATHVAALTAVGGSG